MTHDETYQTDKFGDLLMLVTGGTNYTMAEEHLLYRKALRAVVEILEDYSDEQVRVNEEFNQGILALSNVIKEAIEKELG